MRSGVKTSARTCSGAARLDGMSGYTPVFRSIFQGTLCGKYPELPVWLVLLALADKHGEIDAHPSYIATVSGLPQADIEAAIRAFCEPDPNSRTESEDGRRLLPIPNRGFGWTIVNHGKYREKARLAAKSEREVESGANARRLNARRESPSASDGDRLLPPVTAGDRPSDSDSDADADYGEQLRSSSERSFRPSSSERARQDGTISKKEFRRRKFSAEVASLAKQKAMP